MPALQAAGALAAGDLVPLGGRRVDVELFWQRWNLRSAVLKSIEDAVVTGARRFLRS